MCAMMGFPRYTTYKGGLSFAGELQPDAADTEACAEASVCQESPKIGPDCSFEYSTDPISGQLLGVSQVEEDVSEDHEPVIPELEHGGSQGFTIGFSSTCDYHEATVTLDGFDAEVAKMRLIGNDVAPTSVAAMDEGPAAEQDEVKSRVGQEEKIAPNTSGHSIADWLLSRSSRPLHKASSTEDGSPGHDVEAEVKPASCAGTKPESSLCVEASTVPNASDLCGPCGDEIIPQGYVASDDPLQLDHSQDLDDVLRIDDFPLYSSVEAIFRNMLQHSDQLSMSEHSCSVQTEAGGRAECTPDEQHVAFSKGDLMESRQLQRWAWKLAKLFCVLFAAWKFYGWIARLHAHLSRAKRCMKSQEQILRELRAEVLRSRYRISNLVPSRNPSTPVSLPFPHLLPLCSTRLPHF